MNDQQRLLFHLPLCPFSRQARIILAEKGFSHEARLEPIWERREDFLALNPANTVPVLVEPDGTVVSGILAVRDYLEEMRPEPCLLPGRPAERAEIRRLVAWFDEKFHEEVGHPLTMEKVYKWSLGLGEPCSTSMRAARTNLRHHMDYLDYLTERRHWLAGDILSLADVVAAAHLSCIDYLGDVPWDNHPEVRDWYARIKSRPSMRGILDDQIPKVAPARHYADLDF